MFAKIGCETGYIGVQSGESPIVVDDGVHCAERAGIVAQAIEKGDHILLVRHRDIRAEHIVVHGARRRWPQDLWQYIGEAIGRINTRGAEGGIVEGGREAMPERMTDQDSARFVPAITVSDTCAYSLLAHRSMREGVRAGAIILRDEEEKIGARGIERGLEGFQARAADRRRRQGALRVRRIRIGIVRAVGSNGLA